MYIQVSAVQATRHAVLLSHQQGKKPKHRRISLGLPTQQQRTILQTSAAPAPLRAYRTGQTRLLHPGQVG